MTIVDGSMNIQISEYGKVVREYSDRNQSRFLLKAKELLVEHLDRYTALPGTDVKNIQIHIYTQ